MHNKKWIVVLLFIITFSVCTLVVIHYVNVQNALKKSVVDAQINNVSNIEKYINNYSKVDGYLNANNNVGDYVYFGKYYDIENDEIIKNNLKWKVIDKIGNSYLLITDKIIRMLPYHDKWQQITWEQCTLRKWLNEEFYNDAFDEYEKEKIVPVNNKNGNNNDTIDTVFLLSVDEASAYYIHNMDTYKAVGTKFAIMEGLWVSNTVMTKGHSVWWLRTQGSSLYHAALMHAGGSIGRKGDNVEISGNGVRPCIWVKII